MDMNYYKQYEPIFGVWKINRLIGEGSFGKVFEIQREDFGIVYKAALKVITIPANQAELRGILEESMDEASAREFFGSFVQELVREFALMSKLKGNSNIVSYENHQVIEHKDGIGWDILIQMELLTPLNEYTRSHMFTRQDVIKVGIDMCKALELCQKYNIIHRDVKPENMFISGSGDFKLGDFGIARTVEKTSSVLSKKGTYSYMAPEVYVGKEYGSTVDIYSLGIVLYRLLNENRIPFLPAYPAAITYADRESALMKRFSGMPLPFPVHGEGRLGEIVLKACAFDPAQRYSSPMQMRQELEAILYNREEGSYIYPDGDEAPQKSVQYIGVRDKSSVGQLYETQTYIGAEIFSDETESEFGTVREERTQSDFGPVISEELTADRNEPSVEQKKEKAKVSKKLLLLVVCVGLVLCITAVWTAAAARNRIKTYELSNGRSVVTEYRDWKEYKSTVYHADGSMDYYDIYKYENEADKKQCTGQCTYDINDRLIKESWFDIGSDLEYSAVFEYDENGSNIKTTNYRSDGTLNNYYINEFDQGGNLVKYSLYNADDTLECYCIIEQDKDGNEIRHIYNADGTLRRTLVNEKPDR